MKAPALELGDIFRLHGPAYLTTFGDSLSHEQKKALRAIALCRTAALGGHVDQCDRCGYRKISYCSCRNRPCPKCHGQARARWLEQRAAELLPVEYFHVVFTLPQLVAPLALQNQQLVYGILFRAAAETLLQIAADPRHLGARIGFLAVLHTWGQNLHHHPHLHCVVPGGGIAPDRGRWISCRRQFLFPVKVLSRLFRGKFVAYLKTAFRRKESRLSRRAEAPARPAELCRMAKAACRDRMGSLCQAAVRRTATSAEVPGALYPSGSHLQSAPDLAGGRPSDLPREELCSRK